MARKTKKINTTTTSFKDSVKTKLILIMALLVAVPLIIAIIVSYESSTSKAKSDALSLMEANANYVEAQFSTIIQNNIIALETFAYSPSTITYLNTVGTEEQAIPDSVILNQMDLINTCIGDDNYSVILTKPSGDQLLRTDGNELANISDREYFQEAISGEIGISDVVVSKSAGNRISIICVPIYDDQTGALLGTIQRSIDLANLHDFLAASVSDGYITDSQGIVAAHAMHEITAEDEPEDHSDAEYMINTSEESGMYESTFTGSLAYIFWVREPVTGYVIVIAEQNSVIMAEAIKSALIVVIIGIILLVIAIAISLIMANGFTKPIIAVNKGINELADGRFNKISLYDKRKDEFGDIVRNTNALIDKLQSIVESIKNSASTVTVSSEDLSDMANQISSTTEGVSTAVQEIAAGAVQQAEEIQEAAENVGKITDAVGGVQHSTGNMETLANRMKDASETSSESLTKLQVSSSDMTQKIEEIARTISATQDAVSNINERVEGISGIASQTNLLSLNASIEAARAGEAGKGFAVVAEEIRKLADDSESMAQEIRTEMDILLHQAEAAVAAAGEVKQGNLDQQTALGETLDSINSMLSDINETVLGVKEIAGGADTCVTSNDVVSDAMSALSAISQQNAASSETTGASVEELSATVANLANSATELKEIAEKLNAEMEFFK